MNPKRYLPMLAAIFAATPIAAAPPVLPHKEHHQPKAEALIVKSVDHGGDRHEITLTGREFISQDRIEGELLLRSALLARQKGADWFALLHLPGERPGVHPARANPAFGAAYGHWQPHWSYYRAGEGWQPWHPEWNTPFWTKDVDPTTIEQFEVHAMIQLGRGKLASDAQPLFNPELVVKDLRPMSGASAR